MTKEELKQEAEEWIAKNSKEFITNHNYSFFDYAEAIYLAGAEPREKRITELEETINKLREQLALRYDLEDKLIILKQENEKLRRLK